VEGHEILDGIIATHETIHSLKFNKTPSMLMKLDMSKACDRLNWSFLEQLLRAFCFFPAWVSLF
jgi:hypothetical protein